MKVGNKTEILFGVALMTLLSACGFAMSHIPTQYVEEECLFDQCLYLNDGDLSYRDLEMVASLTCARCSLPACRSCEWCINDQYCKAPSEEEDNEQEEGDDNPAEGNKFENVVDNDYEDVDGLCHNCELHPWDTDKPFKRPHDREDEVKEALKQWELERQAIDSVRGVYNPLPWMKKEGDVGEEAHNYLEIPWDDFEEYEGLREELGLPPPPFRPVPNSLPGQNMGIDTVWPPETLPEQPHSWCEEQNPNEPFYYRPLPTEPANVEEAEGSQENSEIEKSEHKQKQWPEPVLWLVVVVISVVAAAVGVTCVVYAVSYKNREQYQVIV